MKAGDRYIAIGEEGFVVEVINKNDETTFDAKVISFPKKAIRWTNAQRAGQTGGFYQKDFKPDIAHARSKKLNELGI
jgi:hypothetical protein